MDAASSHMFSVVEAEHYWRIEQGIVNQIDALYDELSSKLQPAMVWECLGDDPARHHRLSREDWLQGASLIRKTLRDATPESVTQWRRERWERLRAEADQRRSKATLSGQPPSPE